VKERARSVNQSVCVFITTGPSTKLTSVSHSERGGEGCCVKEGGGGEGKRERERALERLRYYIPGH
jgi:hypothetical protein